MHPVPDTDSSYRNKPELRLLSYNPAKIVILEGLKDKARVNNSVVTVTAQSLLRSSMMMSGSLVKGIA